LASSAQHRGSRVGLAMSGGVDSSAAALLLAEQHQLHGFLMDIGQPGFERQVEQVASIAGRLDIQLSIVDLKEPFKALVLDYFTSSYLSGTTPNPCIVCNREIKCGLLLTHVLAAGFDYMATGHYVRTEAIDGETRLYKGADPKKDQSYFLARLSSFQLSKMKFPLGSMHKEATYRFVESHGFKKFRGNESQDICFLENTSVAEFLDRRISTLPSEGPVVTLDGREVGRHRGLHRYTVGQRRGLGLPDTTPWYVCGLDTVNNCLIVGKNQDLFVNDLHGLEPHWLVSEPPSPGDRFQVKIRSTHHGAEAALTAIGDERIRLDFDEPQRGVSPGQFAVLYDDDRVIGSARIDSSHRSGSS